MRARSAYGHRSTLLHYVSANGVENRRQRTPRRILEIVQLLLGAGADPDAPAGSYGEGDHNTPLCLTVSSGHPAEAGLQGAIVQALLDGGAALEGVAGTGMPLATALAFGYVDTAELLVERGARVRTLVAAAGLGRADLLRELLEADALEAYVDPFGRPVRGRQSLLDRALLQAARPAHTEVGRLLLEAGADPNATFEHGRRPLHWVAYAGRTDFAELLLEYGADAGIREEYYGATPAEWAAEGGHGALAGRLAELDEGGSGDAVDA